MPLPIWLLAGLGALAIAGVIVAITIRGRRERAEFLRRFQTWRCPGCGLAYRLEDLAWAIRDRDLGREDNDWVSGITCAGCGKQRYVDKYGADAPVRD